jgi:putative DNA primase/helicase
MNNIDLFREAMAGAGIHYSGEIIADSLLHRFTADGDKGHKRNSWYVLHDDALPAGAYGCWQRGINETWSAKPEREYSQSEREQHAQNMAIIKQQREQELRERRTLAKNRAAAMWEKARKPKTCKDHFYTAEKQIHPIGIRVLNDLLLVPVYTPACELVGLQTIGKDMYGDTVKKFIPGTPINGNYCPIGKAGNAGNSLCIGEGFATMASVYMATGWPCVVAFSANNLEAVALAMRAKFPEVKIVICADDDSETEKRTGKNPGLDAANNAAAAVGGYVAIPRFNQEAVA